MVTPQHQYSLPLIPHQVGASIVQQRASDGYINATELCRAAGKRWNDYFDPKRSQDFFEALSRKTGKPVLVLIQRVRSEEGIASTWIHPQIAIHLGQWLSADFAVQVSEWVHEWMSGGGPSRPAALPFHLARYLANDNKVPGGYFSMLQEASLGLIGPLHNLGFEIPKGWVPDISIGKMFCAWLREHHGVDTDALSTYSHDYQDSRGVVQAKLYPDDYLAAYRTWFRTIWLPRHGINYFRKRDPNSLSYVDKLPALASPPRPRQLRNR